MAKNGNPKTWLITGANRGIGLALTLELLRGGEHVVAAARNPWGGALAELASEHSDALSLLEIDVTSDGSVADAAAALEGRPLDVLINNAGVYGPRGKQSALEIDFAAWREVFEVNVYAPLRVARAFLPHIEAAEGGKVATISSRMGSIGLDPSGEVAYRSSKAAVNMTMVLFGNAVRERGITNLLFHPGWVQTDMGGAAADIPASQSAAGLIATIQGSGPGDTNSFRTWDGQPIPW